MNTFKLKSGNLIPSLGFGTWQISGDEGFNAVSFALETGYRHIDTAKIYGNHDVVGKAISESGIDRNELFVTSKVWRDMLKKENVRPALEEALRELKLDYLDLYLIHWPDSSLSMKETIEELVKLREEGLIKSLGVSNFTVKHLEDLSNLQEVAVSQVESHPSLNQKELLEFCNEQNIVLTAYSPIGQGEDLKLEQIIDLAKRKDASPSQIILAWLREKGIVAIPRSANEDHIKDNFESLGITLK